MQQVRVRSQRAARARPAAPAPLDHVGWRLWRAAGVWRRRFETAMAEEGYAWYSGPRADLLLQLDDDGTPQAALPRRVGISKQAVQQIIDALEGQGVVRRRPLDRDGRGKQIELTPRGWQVTARAREVKARLDAEYAARIGPTAYRQLMRSLALLGEL